MFSKPQAEHHWLDQLVGSWKFEHECGLPGEKPSMTPGHMTCRSLGGLWLIAESTFECGTEAPAESIMTLGFDPAENQYVGTFVGSMMANLWPYRGVLDDSGKSLPLHSEGPKFDGSGTCRYRDTIRIVDAGLWLFTSEMLTDDGNWVQFLDGRHTRV